MCRRRQKKINQAKYDLQKGDTSYGDHWYTKMGLKHWAPINHSTLKPTFKVGFPEE
jgi:hypothetical protein